MITLSSHDGTDNGCVTDRDDLLELSKSSTCTPAAATSSHVYRIYRMDMSRKIGSIA